MLGSMLDGAKTGILKYIILFFIVMAAGGLVLTDVGGFFTRGAPIDSVASIDGEKITIQKFDRDFRNIAYRQGISAEQAYQFGLADQYLQSVIASALLTHGAKDNGLRLSSEELVKDVQQFISPYIDDKTDAKTAFQNLLRSQNMNEKEFIETLESEKIRNMILTVLTGATIIPGDLATDIALLQKHKRDVSALVININAVDIDNNLDEEALKTYYESIKFNYVLPEKRDIATVTLSPDKLKANITESQKKEFYEDNVAMYSTAEQREIEQALVKDQDLAQKIYTQTKDGNDLKQAVLNVTGNDKAYRSIDNYEESGLLAVLSGPIFSAKNNTLLAPIKSPLGWHIVHVIRPVKGSVQSYASVQKEIEETLKIEAIEEQLYELSGEIQDMLDGGATAMQIAEKFELPTKTFKDIETTQEKFEKLTDNPRKIIEHAFGIEDGESSMLFEDGANYIALTVTNVTPEQFIPYEEIKDSIKKRYTQKQKEEKARITILDLKAKIDSNQISFADGANEKHVSLKKNTGLSQNTTVPPRHLTQQDILSLFNAQKDETLFIENRSHFVIAKIDAIHIPSEKMLKGDDIKRQGEQLSSLLQDLNAQRYTEGLQTRHKVKMNNYVLERLYGASAQ